MSRIDPGLLAKLTFHEPVELQPFTMAGLASSARVQQTLDCGPEPVVFSIDWPSLEGADAVEIDPATLHIGPPPISSPAISLGELVSREEAGALVVEVPAERRIRSLHIGSRVTVRPGPGSWAKQKVVTVNGFSSDGVYLASRSEVEALGFRLAITAIDPDGQYFAPVVTVPEVPAGGQRAAMFTGGEFHNGVLTLPDVAAATLRIALVKGDAPDFPETRPLSAHSVTGWASPAPRELTVEGPDGNPLWSFPGELAPGTPSTAVDLTIGVQGAMHARFAVGAPLTGAVTLTAKHPSRVSLSAPPIRGALLRSIRGTTTAVLAGSPAPIPIGGESLPSEVPTSAVADVHVSYDGIRLAELSDLLPNSRAVEGIVVGGEPVVRTMPPLAMSGERIARVGLIGRVRSPAEISVHVFDASPGAGYAPLGPPAVISCADAPANGDIEALWAAFDPPITVDRPIGFSVTATSGTLLWVADPDPRVRVAIVDPDPGGRPILLADETLLTLSEPQSTTVRAALPGAPFRGGGGDAGQLVFSSALFCTVELTDVTLRYARGGGA